MSYHFANELPKVWQMGNIWAVSVELMVLLSLVIIVFVQIVLNIYKEE